ncbi:MAG: MarR family transcriptional regulator [Planctomycetota bacterium]
MSDALTESKRLLVRRWGEMGGYWGISRTMAEIHALLFVAGRPLCTDDVMSELHVSRGNASMNLRALVDWGLVQRVHHFGDRKEYFQADADVWHMFETILRERRRREVEPVIGTIDRCRALVAEERGAGDEAAELVAYRRRLDDLRDFLATMSTLFELVLRFGREGLTQFAALLAAAESDGTPPSPRATAPRRHPGASPPGARRQPRRKTHP